LNLNVFTSKVDNKKRAVMVYIHGGAFIMGGGASYFFGPNYLLENDIVLVTFNYRLGAFGFLATDDKAAPGNMGIMDQIMVLKWVQKNIAQFGGDPSKVTVFGEDSGAASATILAMSPLATGTSFKIFFKNLKKKKSQTILKKSQKLNTICFLI
jgi:carboxylesterase type B